MKTYQEFLAESTVKEDEYNLAAAGVGAKSKNAFRNLTFGWDVGDKVSISAHVSKSRSSKKKTTLHASAGYSTFIKTGTASAGFDNISNIVKEADSIKASLKGMSAEQAQEFLKAQGWKKL